MKIGFFGTPDIAAYILEELVSNFDVVFLVAPEDKEFGRSRKLTVCPTKEFAQCNEIPIMQPVKLNDPEFIAEIQKYEVDIFVVVAYGKIIPQSIFDMPRLGTINFHPSLLPKYRGAAPVQWSLIDGNSETGITIQRINERLDAGDVIVQEKLEIDENIASCDLFQKILPQGADLLVKAIKGLDDGSIIPIVQDESQATYCGKIDREIANIDWHKKSNIIHNLIRGLNPKPIAWTSFRESNMKVWISRIPEAEDLEGLALAPGELLKFQKRRLFVGTGEGIIEILKLQPENKKVMDSQAFLNGYRIDKGEFFK